MKKIIFVITCFFAGISSYAQTDALRQKLDSIFQYINKNQIPTGYLKEYGSEMVPMHYFNGLVTDSNNVESLDIFRTLYADLYTAKLPVQEPGPEARPILPGILQPLTQVNNLIDTVRLSGTSSVAVLFGQYASLKPTALNENLFTISNEQLYDVAGRPASPYLTNSVFAAAAIGKLYINTVSLKYDASLYFSNTNISISSLSVDFLDGNGYQIITGAGFSKTYADSSSYKLVVYKAVMNNGTTMYCKGSIAVRVTQSNLARYTDTDPVGREIPISSLTANSGAYNNVQDKLQIRYAVNNPTRLLPAAQRLVRKPLIYVEGYDVEGDYDIYDLIRFNPNNQNDNGEWINLANIANGYDFMHDLDDVAGYDLIFVNYNTLRSIPTNALMLQEVIQWANAQKAQAGSTDKNVVLGVSAGGLVARYCLANMTKNIGYNSTDTRLLITHDSPHQGANVPMSLQYFLYDIAYTNVLGTKVLDTQEELKKFIALNAAPATAQLLRARATHYQMSYPGPFGTTLYVDMVGTEMNSFLVGPSSPYQQMVNIAPAQRPYQFIATSQGSQCGIPVIDGSNITIARQDALFTKLRVPIPIWFGKKYWLNTTLKSLPAMGSATIEDYNMTARTSIFGIGFGWKTIREVHRDNPSNFNDWDGVPGSTQSIAARTKGALTKGVLAIHDHGSSNIPEPFVIVDGGLSLTIVKDLFSFISTTSALDATQGISAYTAFNFVPNGNANTATDKYISQSKLGNFYNIGHTDYTARNARWIFNEMQNITQPITCQDYCLNDLKISPNAGICGNSNTYEIANLPPGATVAWSVTPTGIVTPNTSNANPVTLTTVTSGTVTLAANVTLPCSNTVGNTTSTKNFSKVLQVGNVGFGGTYNISINGSSMGSMPFTGNTSSFIQAQRGQNVSVAFNIYNSQNLTNLRWSTGGYYINGYGNSFVYSVNASTYQYSTVSTTIYFYADSPCGPVQYTFRLDVFSSLRMMVTASPNPSTTGEINIAVTKEHETTARPANFPAEVKALNPYTKITITPLNSNLPAKTLLFKEDTNINYKINTKGLTAGTYAVTVERNNIITTTKIIVL